MGRQDKKKPGVCVDERRDGGEMKRNVIRERWRGEMTKKGERERERGREKGVRKVHLLYNNNERERK